MLLWLQRPPHHEGTLYQDWWILLNTILRSCPDLQGWVQQQRGRNLAPNCFSCVLAHCL